MLVLLKNNARCTTRHMLLKYNAGGTTSVAPIIGSVIGTTRHMLLKYNARGTTRRVLLKYNAGGHC